MANTPAVLTECQAPSTLTTHRLIPPWGRSMRVTGAAVLKEIGLLDWRLITRKLQRKTPFHRFPDMSDMGCDQEKAGRRESEWLPEAQALLLWTSTTLVLLVPQAVRILAFPVSICLLHVRLILY